MLKGMGPCLSVASSVDGVKDITIVVDPVACRGTLRRMVVPSLLPRLGAPSPRPIRAVDGGVDAALPYL